jgi:hypothetical protein
MQRADIILVAFPGMTSRHPCNRSVHGKFKRNELANKCHTLVLVESAC